MCFHDMSPMYGRWGKVTSNSTETMNGVFGSARSLPIVYLTEHLVKYQCEKYHVRYLQACKWSDDGKRITEYARDMQLKLADSASKRNVEVLERNHPIYRARVQVSPQAALTGYLEVKVNLDLRVGNCPCRYQDEIGFNCIHVKALLLALNKQSSWCSRRYQVSTYRTSYSATIPAMTLSGNLESDATILPPDFKRGAGRPSKKRKERSWLRKTTVQRVCKACGKDDHMARTCKEPSTQYRYYQHKESALEWCRQQERREVAE
jgi:hypothetical protein